MLFIAWIVIGLGAGLLAHPLIRGPQEIGLGNKIVAGLGGSIIGGVVGHVLGGARDTGLSFATLVGSIAGTSVLMLIVSLICRALMKE